MESIYTTNFQFEFNELEILLQKFISWVMYCLFKHVKEKIDVIQIYHKSLESLRIIKTELFIFCCIYF